MFSIGFLPHVAVTGLLVALVVAEQDLGTAAILLLVLLVMLFAGGVKLAYLLGAMLLAIPVAWKLVAGTPYRMARITAFLDPWQHRDGVGLPDRRVAARHRQRRLVRAGARRGEGRSSSSSRPPTPTSSPP